MLQNLLLKYSVIFVLTPCILGFLTEETILFKIQVKKLHINITISLHWTRRNELGT